MRAVSSVSEVVRKIRRIRSPPRTVFSVEAVAAKYGLVASRTPPIGISDNIMSWVSEPCPDCDFPKLALVGLRGELEITEKVCVFCGATCGGICMACNNLGCEVRQKLVSDTISQDHIAKAEGYGTVHNIVFGRNQGTVGGAQRNKQLGDAIRKSNPELKKGDVRFMKPYRELQNTVPICPEGPIVKSALEMLSSRIKKVERVRAIKIDENRADNMAKILRKRIKEAKIKPRSKKAREALVEDVLARERFWPA